MDFLGVYTIIQSTTNYAEILQNLGYELRDKEFLDFKVLINLILETSCISHLELVEFTDNFSFGYKIPRIGKEFDLIRLGINYNINIEIKNSSTKEQKIKQIENGAYYLGALKMPTLYFSFDVKEQSMLFGDPVDGEINYRYVKLGEMIERIKDQKVDYLTDIKEVLTPEKFLVNPFTDTELFLKNKYFLNAHQLNIFNEVLNDVSNGNASPVSIEGGAGTGKSLLLYSLANSLIDKRSVIIHSGSLSFGHYELIQQSFTIYPAIEIKNIDYSNLDCIFVDEAQRTYTPQLKILFNQADKFGVKLIFVFDPKQTFADDEDGYKNKEIIDNYTEERNGKFFKLGTKFRSNYRIGEFIKQMFQFNIKEFKRIDNTSHEITIKYYDSYKDFLAHENKIIFNDYVLLGYTSSRYKKDKYYKYSNYGIPHNVVGQEFNNVAVIVDKSFYYEGNKNKTTYRLNSYNDNAYYSGEKMLYNNLTRAREKLFIAVIDNPEIYSRLLQLVNNM